MNDRKLHLRFGLCDAGTNNRSAQNLMIAVVAGALSRVFVTRLASGDMVK